MDNIIDNVEWVSPDEAEALPSMCEIRFDSLVTMYDMGIQKPNELLPFRLRKEIKRKPQWFKNSQKITLNAIKNLDEYSLGRMLKDQFKQLEAHIRQYEMD